MINSFRLILLVFLAGLVLWRWLRASDTPYPTGTAPLSATKSSANIQIPEDHNEFEEDNSSNEDDNNWKKRATRAAVPSYSPPKSIMYWGQDKLGAKKIISTEEPSLLEVCQSVSHEMIVISFIRKHFSTNGAPGLDLANHCTTPMYRGDKYGVNIIPLKCPTIGDHIKQCQSQYGKQILISISPLDILTSNEDAVKSAQNIWNYFLGGGASVNDRPFGNAILDGVDLFFRANDGEFITKFAVELERLTRQQVGKYFILSASPRCSYPDALLGPEWQNLILSSQPRLFNQLILHGMGSPDCTYRLKDLMMTTVKKWIDWAPADNSVSLFLALPARNGHIDDAPGDFIPVASVTSEKVYDKFISSSGKSLTGIAIWEGSAEMASSPCLDDAALISSGKLKRARHYGDLFRPETKDLPCDPTPEQEYDKGATIDPITGKRKRMTSGSSSTSNYSLILKVVTLAVMLVLLVC